MKNSLNLPQSKLNELEKIITIILQNCADVEKIILFGSYARGTYKEAKDLSEDRKSGHVSDYDILVVTATKESTLDSMLWKKVAENCKKLKFSADPRIITHDIEALNIKLAEAQYFFKDIIKDGILLFDKGNFELAEERGLTAKERQRIAQDHYDYWFQRALNFKDSFELMFSKSQFTDAAFHLHQAAESAYKTVLLVFSNYIPREHFLEFLGSEAEKYHELMCNIFAKINEEDEARFKLLEYAYIGGRYDPNYRITKEDLEILSRDVQKLLALTEEICKNRIRSFG